MNPAATECSQRLSIKSGPYTRPISRCPCSFPSHTIGMPSGVQSRARLNTGFNAGSACASLTACTFVTVT